MARRACGRRRGGPDVVQVAEHQTTEQGTGAAGRAKGSSFYLAMRILPRAQREAMFEIYSFCKAVDDIADTEEASREQRIARLNDWRDRIAALYAGEVPNGLEALSHTIKQFGLRQEDFLAIIDGVEMDAKEDIRAPSYETLDLYCDRVASAVGRLSVRVFGLNDEDGRALAHHLGRALQLTNILRDIDEDAEISRLYLPHEALQLAHIEGTDPQAVAANPNLAAACAYVVERARNHFKEADAIMARCPRRLVRAPRLMELAYRKMLDGMVARGWARPRTRVRVSKPHLIGIALRYAFI
jgi:squalene synthase HpnD